AAPPLPADAAGLARLRAAIGDRPVWLAASTHAPEEELIGRVHRRVNAAHPRLLTILAPRHPERGETVAAALAAAGLRVARRSGGALPNPETEIYLADTRGELGLFCRTAPVAFVGGSLLRAGGHNPLEPARLGCAVLHGPGMDNFAEIAAELAAAGGALTVADEAALSGAVARLLHDPAERARVAAAAARVAAARAAVLDAVMTELEP